MDSILEKLVLSEEVLFWAIHRYAGSFLDYPMAYLAEATKTRWLILIGSLIILFFSKQEKIRKLLFYAIPVYLTNIIVILLKIWFERPRPFDTFPTQAVEIFSLPVSYSFPSGHSATIFAAVYLLNHFFNQKVQFLYVIAILVALGRIYLGVHFVSDVVVGVFLGWILGVLFAKIETLLRSQKLKLEVKEK